MRYIVSIFFIFSFSVHSYAVLTKEDLKEVREIIREEMGIYSHQIDKRFEQIDKRLEEMNSRINSITTVFGMMFLGTIGFALWDRRTMIRPFETKVREITQTITLEKDERIKLTEALKEQARTDVKLQAILQKFNIL